MSSSAQSASSSPAPSERRFYPRIALQSPVFVAFAEGKDGLLLNISENGLLISTPAELTCNYVARVSIPLNGLPKPVLVNVRVVWVNEARKLAGIQLLDLSEHDRQLIRKWSARESAQSSPQGPHRVSVVDEIHENSAGSTLPTLASAQEDSSGTLREIAAQTPRLLPRKRLAPATAGIAISLLLLASAGLAVALFVKNGAQPHYFARTLANAYQSSTAVPSPSLVPSVNAAGLNFAPTDAFASQAPAQTPKLTNADDNPSDSKTGTEQNLCHASRANLTSSAKQALQSNRDPDTSLLVAEDSSVPQNDEPHPVAIPPATDSSVPEAMANNTLPPSSDPPTFKELAPDPPRPDDTRTGTSATIPSAPAIPATRSAPPRRTEAPVIQMDPPARQVLEIRLPSGYYAPFFNLSGERVLESSSVTIHIQRSVRMPASHAAWPFNRKKKLVVGELISRVDPQTGRIPLVPGDTVRVSAIVAKDGRVESVRLLEGRPGLILPVIDAVHRWRYQPTLVDGKPVETRCFIEVQFRASATHTAKR